MMDPKIEAALNSAVAIFAEKNELNTKAIQADLIKAFGSDEDF